MLGGIAAAPAVLALGIPTATAKGANNGGSWWRLHACWVRATAEYDRHHGEVWEPGYSAFVEANGGPSWVRSAAETQALYERFVPPEVDERDDRLCEVASNLRERLVALPAPDARAALWKFNYFAGIDDGSEADSTPAWDLAFVAPIIADVQRFLTGEG